MAKWNLDKLPEGRQPLPDEWLKERAQMQERVAALKAKLEKADALAYEVDRRMTDLGGFDNRFTLRKAIEAYRAERTGDKDE